MIVAMILYGILGGALALAHVRLWQYVGITALVMAIDVWSHICARKGGIK